VSPAAEGTVADVLAGRARYAVVCGDATAVLASLPDGCAHVTYCDPGYGLSQIDTADVVACLTAWLAGKPYVHKAAGFMGHEWDSFVPGPEAWREVHRALRPGGYCVAFSSTRTVDLLGIAVRLAGFEMREGWAWNFSAAMPKSLNVSKAIDAAAGAERPVIGKHPSPAGNGALASASIGGGWSEGDVYITAPATEAAAQWEGYGTATKPGYEPIVVARKPLDGTVAHNVTTHGCGALNIDAARISAGGASPSVARRESAARSGNAPVARGATPSGWADRENAEIYVAPRAAEQLGRFPAALALVHSEGCEMVGTRRVRTGTAVNHNRSADDRTSWFGSRAPQTEDAGHADADGMESCDEWVCEPGCGVAELARQSGERPPGWFSAKAKRGMGYGGHEVTDDTGPASCIGDTGTAARFFWQAKASSADRLAFLTCAAGCSRHETIATARDARKLTTCPACGAAVSRHEHSTVKPLDLARYHARLLSLPEHVAPVALVPYCGSGPEARALLEVGFRVIAVDLDPRHCAMTRHRLSQPLGAPQAKRPKAPRTPTAAPVAAVPVVAPSPVVAAPAARRRALHADAGQLDLFARPEAT